MGPEKINVSFRKNCENTGKILTDIILLNLTFIFMHFHKKSPLVLLQTTNYTLSP